MTIAQFVVVVVEFVVVVEVVEVVEVVVFAFVEWFALVVVELCFGIVGCCMK